MNLCRCAELTFKSKGPAMTDKTHQREAHDTAEAGRSIQAKIDHSANENARKDEKQLPRTGARAYPAPPLPQQHQVKPGVETALNPKPMYDAPYYKGSGKLKDKVALVTGGDSGIGRSVAVLYAREGADVAIVYLEESQDARETQAAVEAESRRCILIPGDVSDLAFCKDAVAQTVKQLGKLDILVNNAAFQQHINTFEELTAEQFDRTMKTNVYGYFNMAKAAVPHMKEGSAIVNTGSVTGIEGSKYLLDYSTTKGAIHTFTRSLSELLLARSIRVNCVAPGPVWTPLNPADKSAAQVARFGSDVPMKRPAQPEEIAPAFVFLASAQCSSYITGEILPVIGGYTG